jgi:hypothetical membrane protein
MSKERLIQIIRRSQTFISILVFFTVFIICWWVTKLDIRDIQLSNWGVIGWVGKIWNSSICLFSISIFINFYLYIRNNSRLKYKISFLILFSILSIFLFLVGYFNMNYHQIHYIFALSYFFLYPLVIFIFSHFNRKYLSYNDWVHKVVISVLMAILPLIFIYAFKGMAIAEIAHTTLVIIYNIKLSRQD